MCGFRTAERRVECNGRETYHTYTFNYWDGKYIQDSGGGHVDGVETRTCSCNCWDVRIQDSGGLRVRRGQPKCHIKATSVNCNYTPYMYLSATSRQLKCNFSELLLQKTILYTFTQVPHEGNWNATTVKCNALKYCAQDIKATSVNCNYRRIYSIHKLKCHTTQGNQRKKQFRLLNVMQTIMVMK